MNPIINILKKEENYWLLEIKTHQLQMSEIPIFHSEMKEILNNNPKNIIMDFSNTNYLDSSALGAIFKIHTSVSKYKGNLYLFGFNKTINLILTLTKAERILKIYSSLEKILEVIENK